MPKLTVTLQDGTQNTFDLVDDQLTLGRSPDNILHIDDASVSSHHATLTLLDGDYVYRDIGSTNGSRLNGKNIPAETDHRLQSGDSLLIGKVDGSYESETPAEARPLPEEEEVALTPAASSSAPVNFQNASPFQSKKKKKDPSGTAVLAMGGVAILVFLAALLQILALKAPQLP
ncbi:MAG TPA: FHA domain-containing protein [Chthoniobacteraceae bacterium]|nr:FHA domain-containing protein [Chthoniobacteraceae bacterium]